MEFDRESGVVRPAPTSRRSFRRSRRRQRPAWFTAAAGMCLVLPGGASAAACPDEPVDPPLQPLRALLDAWPVDDPAIPAGVGHQGPSGPSSSSSISICRFDYRSARDRATALRYRDADVPFVLTNHPALAAVAERWGDPEYLARELGRPGQTFRVDVSPSNHFRNAEPPFPADWTPHFNTTRMTLAGFRAAVAATPAPAHDEPHYYLRFCGDEAEDLFRRDLAFFLPAAEAERDPVVMDTAALPERVRCRWGGAAGSVVEAHFDGLRNVAALLSGARRWILAPPRECVNCYTIASDDHPDAPCYRHCEVDWSRPDLARHPRFAGMQALEFILRPGEMVFVPSFWLHAIVHLEGGSLQCNAFSQAVSLRGREAIKACGFEIDERDAAAEEEEWEEPEEEREEEEGGYREDL